MGSETATDAEVIQVSHYRMIACSGLGVDFVCPHQSGVYQKTLSFDGGERGRIGSIQEVIALQGDSRSAQSGVLSAFSG